MHFSPEEENPNLPLSKFESMLRTNKVEFFDSEEFEEIILHYLDQGKATLAKRALKLALEQHPGSTGLQLVHAEILIYDDKVDQADLILNKLLAVEPFNDEIYIQKANIYSKKDQHDKAIEQLQVAAQYTEDPADVYSLMGMEYLFLDELEEAKRCFKICLEEDLEDQTALYNIVYCYEFLNQVEDAILFLESYINQNPYSEIAWHQQGRLLYDLKKYEEALTAFDFAYMIDEFFTGALVEKGKCFEKLKRFDEAIACYLDTLELEDASSYVLLRLGKCYEKTGNKAKAIEFYSKTVHEDPLLDKGWVAITDFYLRQEDYKKALYFINKALAIDNENLQYWKRFARIHYLLENWEDAVYGFEKSITYGETHVESWLLLVDTLIALQENEKVTQVLLDAVEVFPKQTDILARLSGWMFWNHQTEKGIYYLVELLQEETEALAIFEEMFPEVYTSEVVQNTILQFFQNRLMQ